MLQAIHEYARLIREASLTIKHFDDVGSPLKYESLDLSPFRHYKVFDNKEISRIYIFFFRFKKLLY